MENNINNYPIEYVYEIHSVEIPNEYGVRRFGNPALCDCVNSKMENDFLIENELMFDKMIEKIEKHKAHSAWDRGVKDYAFELIEKLKDISDYQERTPKTRKECAEWLLNGAQNWKQFSYGGCSLVYDGDIARRLCNPSELKKTRNGERRPNSREEWLDVQARALFQASKIVLGAYEACRTVDDDGEPLPMF